MTDTFKIFDYNAVVTHSYFAGVDKGAKLIEGENVNTAGYGVENFLSMYLLPAIAYNPLNHIIVAHDDVKRNAQGEFTDYRTKHYPDYKKERRDKPFSAGGEELVTARKVITELLTALGIPQATLPNTEADDVIAYLARNLPGQKQIYTVDADLISLSNENVEVYQRLQLKRDMKGVEPRFITLFKSLCGDTSDGYIGVKGFGPAKWEELNTKQKEWLIYVVENYRETQDAWNTAVERSDSKALKIIAANKKQWIDSYHHLAKIHPELVDSKPIQGFDGDDNIIWGDRFNRLKWVKNVPNRDAVLAVLNKVGCGYLINDLEKFLPTQTLVTPANIDIEKFKRELLFSRYVSLDFETWQTPNENFKKAANGKDFVDMIGSTISGMGITIGWNLEHTYYFQFDHADEENNLNKQVLLELLDAIPAHMPVLAYNSYFESVVLQSEFGVALPIMYDPFIMHKHIDELAKEHDLKSLTKRHMSYDQIKYEDIIAKGKTMKNYTGQHVFKYGADDPLVTAHLFDLFYIILNLEHTWEFVRDNEFPSVQLLAEAHVDGVTFDFTEVEKQREEDQAVFDDCVGKMRELLSSNPVGMGELQENALKLYLADVNPKGSENGPEVEELTMKLLYQDWKEVPPTGRQKVSRWVGTELNLKSSPQMIRLFYGTLGFPIRIRDFKVSDTREKLGLQGTPQINEDMFEEAIFHKDVTLNDWKYQVLELFLKAKTVSTRLSNFYHAFPLWQHPKTGNVHPKFNSCGTESHRPTGGMPNLLQLPKKDEGLKVRKCILPNKLKGHDLVCSIDWAGEELRLIAHVARDAGMTSCYLGDNLRDIHTIVAAEIMKVPYSDFCAVLEDEKHPDNKEYKNARKAAKAVNFGSNYGIGAAKLARQLRISEEEAKSYLNAKRSAYSGVESWKLEVKDFIEQNGYVQTMYGVRKHLFNYYAQADEQRRRYYERSSVNFLIQGLASDYLKIVLAELYRKKTFQRHGAMLIAPIYDEIVWSCHSSQATSLINEVYAVMTQGIPGMEIPMLASPSVGINFGDQKEVLKNENQKLTDELIQIAINKALNPTV